MPFRSLLEYLLGASLRHFGTSGGSLDRPGGLLVVLSASGGPLGAAWGPLGGLLEASWGYLGAMLGPSWRLLGPPGRLFGPSWRPRLKKRGVLNSRRPLGGSKRASWAPLGRSGGPTPFVADVAG